MHFSSILHPEIPVTVSIREFAFRIVMPWGSAAIAVVAMVWLVQRALFPTG